MAPPPRPGHRRSAADPALAPVYGISDNDQSQYRSVARWSGARFPVGIAIRCARLPRARHTHSDGVEVQRSLGRLSGEWLCCAAGRRRTRTYVPAFSDFAYACLEKRVRLVACWPAGLPPVAASASRFLAAVLPAPAPVASRGVATARSLGVIAQSPGALPASTPEAELPSASIHARWQGDPRPWSLLTHFRDLP